MRPLKDLYNEISSNIWFYEKEEAKEIAFLLMQKLWNINRTDLLIQETNKQLSEIETYIERINQGEPIQYIHEEAWFKDRKFEVNPNVLIPRVETEELVNYIVPLKPKTILDLGTGSGCIPISLALEISDSEVFAIDISEGALTLAQKNAQNNEANVNFAQANILNFINPFQVETFDLIVSNPPYVKENEKAEMRKNVLDFEPHLALFVSNDDPLIFYRNIGEIGLKHLNPNGSIWVEINSYLGQETADLFKSQGYTQVRLLKDLFGKERFIEIKK